MRIQNHEYGRGRNLGEAVAGYHGEGAAGEEAGEVDHRLAHYGVAIVLQYNFFYKPVSGFFPSRIQQKNRQAKKNFLSYLFL
jgi:hypothetical protein